jgi:hypothetical protein
MIVSSRVAPPSVEKINRIQLILFGMQNKTFGPCLAASSRILISLHGQISMALSPGAQGKPKKTSRSHKSDGALEWKEVLSWQRSRLGFL